jgi:lipid-A-disaccharide synthase
MTLWPYEPPYFEKYGLRCDFVGHPVVENTANLCDDLADFRRRHGVPGEATLLCALPGSRSHEVKSLAPIFKRVATRLSKQIPDLFVIIPSVAAMAEAVRRAFADMQAPHCVVVGQRERYNAFRASTFAVAASGSVTLELAACGTPHLIAYTFDPITNRIADKLVTSKYANLINILAGKLIIPEFTLTSCREEPIYQKSLELMLHPDRAKEQVAQAQQYFSLLKPSGSMPSEKAAAVVMEVMGG